MTLGIRATAWTTAVAAVMMIGGCGGSSPTGPSGGSSGPGGTPGPSGATITIGANGAVSPAQVTIAVGQSVTFVNNNSRGHDMSSDPHPSHTDCPQVNAVGTLATGQTKLTNAFTTARTCGFHDHNQPENSSLQGRIVIQ